VREKRDRKNGGYKGVQRDMKQKNWREGIKEERRRTWGLKSVISQGVGGKKEGRKVREQTGHEDLAMEKNVAGSMGGEERRFAAKKTLQETYRVTCTGIGGGGLGRIRREVGREKKKKKTGVPHPLGPNQGRRHTFRNPWGLKGSI